MTAEFRLDPPVGFIHSRQRGPDDKSIRFEIPGAALEQAAKDVAVYEVRVRETRDELRAGDYSLTTNAHIDAVLGFAEERSEGVRFQLPETDRGRFKQEDAVKYMKHGKKWRPGFKPEELLKEFKIKAPRQTLSKFKFTDQDQNERAFDGFVAAINEKVWSQAKKDKREVKTLKAFSDNARHKNAQWRGYRALLLELHDDIAKIYLQSSAKK